MTTRAALIAAYEAWADSVRAEDLREVDRSILRTIAELTDQRAEIDAAITDAVRQARSEGRSWSEIGAMLCVTKQAAQRKYGSVPAA